LGKGRLEKQKKGKGGGGEIYIWQTTTKNWDVDPSEPIWQMPKGRGGGGGKRPGEKKEEIKGTGEGMGRGATEKLHRGWLMRTAQKEGRGRR